VVVVLPLLVLVGLFVVAVLGVLHVWCDLVWYCCICSRFSVFCFVLILLYSNVLYLSVLGV